MGVPAFFRWLTVRYPKVVIDAISTDDLEVYADEFAKEKNMAKAAKEADPNEINLDEDEEDKALKLASKYQRERTEKAELNARVKNNNPAVDNLYLDMNGIIHPCSAP